MKKKYLNVIYLSILGSSLFGLTNVSDAAKQDLGSSYFEYTDTSVTVNETTDYFYSVSASIQGNNTVVIMNDGSALLLENFIDPNVTVEMRLTESLILSRAYGFASTITAGTTISSYSSTAPQNQYLTRYVTRYVNKDQGYMQAQYAGNVPRNGSYQGGNGGWIHSYSGKIGLTGRYSPA